MGAGSGHADAEQEQGRSGERLRPLLARVLHSRHASKSTLGEAAAALKQACGHDFDEWCKHALAGPSRLPCTRPSFSTQQSAWSTRRAPSRSPDDRK